MPSLPTRHQLFAALEVLRVLGHEQTPTESVRSGYRLLASEGLFGFSDYRAGEDLLVAAGYAQRSGTTICRTKTQMPPTEGLEACRLLLAAFLIRTDPTWVSAATRGDAVWIELVPNGVVESLETTFRGEGEREAFLLSIGQKYHGEPLVELGAAGELSVIEAWQQALADNGVAHLQSSILHSSLQSDALGYDISAPTLDGGVRRLEVKTVGQSRKFLTIFLTRNEFETGTRDPSWRLIVCKRVEEGAIVVQGWLPIRDLEPFAPKDVSDAAVWAVVRIDLANEQIRPGLPIDGTSIE